MTSKNIVWLIILGIAFCFGPRALEAQDAQTAKSTDIAEKPLPAFRLDFVLFESEDGKRINTRHYSMNAVPGFINSNEIKIGTRVPVETQKGEMQYIDVGTNISSRMVEKGDSLQLEVRADLSNFANPEQENRTTMPGGRGRPSHLYQALRFLKDLHKHLPSELASIGVLIRGMIRRQQNLAVRHLIPGRVPKNVEGFCCNQSAAF